MSLDLGKLEKVRELANGVVRARCPACAADGHDRTGEHLRIYPDGRFGCCVHPKDREHRKRIFALAGDKTPGSFTVKVAPSTTGNASARSVTASLVGYLRTVRTAVSGSDSSKPSPEDNLRTLRTPIFNPRAYARETEGTTYDNAHTCKDSKRGVLSVLTAPTVRLPYLTADGTLVIPFDSPERFHWWKGGQSVATTLAELRSWMAGSQPTQTVEGPEAERTTPL